MNTADQPALSRVYPVTRLPTMPGSCANVLLTPERRPAWFGPTSKILAQYPECDVAPNTIAIVTRAIELAADVPPSPSAPRTIKQAAGTVSK